jgi:hypothetical protein
MTTLISSGSSIRATSLSSPASWRSPDTAEAREASAAGSAATTTTDSVAVLDALGLDNSLARSKVLIGAVTTAAKLLEAEREESYGWEGEQ